MTRFGMEADDFAELAQLMADVITGGKSVQAEVKAMRSRFDQMRYCFAGTQIEDLMQQLHKIV